MFLVKYSKILFVMISLMILLLFACHDAKLLSAQSASPKATNNDKIKKADKAANKDAHKDEKLKQILINTAKAKEFEQIAQKTQTVIDQELAKIAANPGLMPVIGLNNCGNTCYMNALLQALLHSDLGRYTMVPFTQISFAPNIQKNDSLFELFYYLSADYRNTAAASVSTSDIADARATFMPTLAIGLQADATEYLQFFFARISEELNAIAKLPKDRTASDAEKANFLFSYYWEKAGRNGEYSIINDLFSGFFKNEVKKATGENVITYESFNTLALEFPPSTVSFSGAAGAPKEISLDALIKAATEEEKLIGSPGNISKKLSIFKAPKNLIVSLKRFQTDVLGGPAKKIITNVNYPLTLKLNTPIDNDVEYELFALVLQHGGLGGGHYTARVKNASNNWFIADDSTITPTTEDTVLKEQEAAYVLFYKRK